MTKKPKRLTWKGLLKQVVTRLNKHDEGSVQLWAVLSALRGPDNSNQQDKAATTGIIRHKIGLTQGGPNWAVVNEDSEGKAQRRADAELAITNIHYHFQQHAAKAFSALGMKWGEVNQ